MKKTTTRWLFTSLILSFFLTNSCKENPSTRQNLTVKGLTDAVEVIRDPWGINHIYAQNQRDLFFAQGYCAAKDRLFQFEIWRRQATGTVAEILGARELQRDIGTRLFQFRGNMEEEMRHYHPDGVEIITAYVDGVNAYIQEIRQQPNKLPIAFAMLDILPELWTPEVVISRHQGLLGNIGTELEIGRMLATLGEEKVRDLYWFHPQSPDLNLHPSINKDMLDEDILQLYEAYRQPVRFQPSDVVEAYRAAQTSSVPMDEPIDAEDMDAPWTGSNNWIVQSELMESGRPLMANDPHRTLAVPSLRYWAHLHAPGWNVIGGGEPEIPGISIGHNEHGAWGLTVFRTDGEDLYVYDLNPENLFQYRYQGQWVDMEAIPDTIRVKGTEDHITIHHYTRHGPVCYIDSSRFKAYAVRSAWLEVGGSPYLASLRMDQARNWEEFRDACTYSHIPGENMIWADTANHIGWQAVGIAPIRRNFSGMIPVPGDGSYEWDGYLPIEEKPNVYDPPERFFATANQNVSPEDYTHWDAITYLWSDPYRGQRVNEVLTEAQPLTMDEMKALQTDYTDLAARSLIPLLARIDFAERLEQAAQDRLLQWDQQLNPQSQEAGIFVAFENQLHIQAWMKFVPEEGKEYMSRLQLAKVVQWLLHPDNRFGEDPKVGRDTFIKQAFSTAIQELSKKFGADIEQWKYGQAEYKHVQIHHPLSGAISPEWQEKLDTKIAPRGGNAYTPGSTSWRLNQSSGASFRIIVDVGEWDRSIGSNSPGQSGDPESPFYMNLFDSWAKDEFFPVYYSRNKIDSVAVERIQLLP